MLILESVVTTRNPDGSPHIAPLGKRYARDEEPDWGLCRGTRTGGFDDIQAGGRHPAQAQQERRRRC